MLHKAIVAGDVHIIHNWEVADAAARNALVVSSIDIGKVARQAGDNTFWVLANHVGPSWIQLTNATSMAASTITLVDAASIIKATEVEGALQEIVKNDKKDTRDLTKVMISRVSAASKVFSYQRFS